MVFFYVHVIEMGQTTMGSSLADAALLQQSFQENVKVVFSITPPTAGRTSGITNGRG